MNIGFVSAWCEQGAGYVTKQYLNLIKDKHRVFVFVRGNRGEFTENWNQGYVTWGNKLPSDMSVSWKKLKKWICKNNIEVVLFNEQQDMSILAQLKLDMPNIVIGAYIDYYKRNTISMHTIYDFLICNTKRHYDTFCWHPQCYYVPWGTETELYKPQRTENDGVVTFFHSMGNGDRKGTKILLDVFVNSDLCEKSKLIIHTQSDAIKKYGYNYNELLNANVEVIEKTVAAPGLYYLGDVYVYPSELDGLGLTIYEALSSGLPVIGTDVPPINEPINQINGKLVAVGQVVSREDGYYWPLSIVEKNSLYDAMKYYVDNYDRMEEIKEKVRNDAMARFTWESRKEQVLSIFEEAACQDLLSQEEMRSFIKKKTLGEKIDKVIMRLSYYFSANH